MKIFALIRLCVCMGISLVTACNAAPVDFRRMSDAELIAYNRTVEYWDQVYCSDEIRAGSHIKRRQCETYNELRDRLINSAESLNVLGSSRIF